jgi:uncharacterized membrane protein
MRRKTWSVPVFLVCLAFHLPVVAQPFPSRPATLAVQQVSKTEIADKVIE